jgi:hypothetical protein
MEERAVLDVAVAAYASARAAEGPAPTRPLARCLVTVRRGRTVVGRQTTDASGVASFQVPAGSYQVAVDLPRGYRPVRKAIDVEVDERRRGRVDLLARPRFAVIAGDIGLPPGSSDADDGQTLPLVAIELWQGNVKIAATATASDGRYELRIDTPGTVQVRPAPELVDERGQRLVPDVAALVIEAPAGARRLLGTICYSFADGTIRLQVRRQGESFELYQGETASGPPLRRLVAARDQAAVTFPDLGEGRYTLVAIPPAGAVGDPIPRRASMVVELQAGARVDLGSGFEFRPVDQEERDEADGGAPPGPPDSPAERSLSMPAQGGAADRPSARIGELATITIKVEFPEGDPQGIMTTGVQQLGTSEPAPAALTGQLAVMHLLNVEMRGEIEERLERELRDTVGPEATLDALIMKKGSVEILIAIGLVLATVRDVNETVNAVEELSGRAIAIVHWALRRMPRSTPSPPPHVVSGYWSRGTLLLPTGPAGAVEEAEEVEEQADRRDRGRGPLDPTRMLTVYLLIANAALIATLLVMVLLRR